MSITIKKILEIENKKELWDIKCHETNLPIWPIIRIYFFREIISDLFYDKPFESANAKKSSLLNEILLYVQALIWNYNFFRKKSKYEILLITNSVADYIEDGMYKNRLTDNFFDNKENTLTLLEQHARKHPFPRINNNTILKLPYQFNVLILSFFKFKKNSEQVNELIRLILLEAEAKVNWKPTDIQNKKLKAFISKKIKMLPIELKKYKEILNKISPKIIIGLCLSYGSMMPLIAAARQQKIKVVEFQHGVISSGHDAYNFGEKCINFREISQMIPDEILLYGKWWENQFNMPIKKIIIGNSARINKITGKNKPLNNNILVLGDGIDTTKYLYFCEKLQQKLIPFGYKVTFRPHQLEKEYLYFTVKKSKLNLSIDESKTIYEAFENSSCVISEISTGLFDAIGHIPKIMVWKTDKALFNNIKHPFQEFLNEDDFLIKYFQGNIGLVDKETINQIWDAEYDYNFKNYLKKNNIKCN